MKVVAQHLDLLMVVKDDVKVPVEFTDKCIVYNTTTKEFSPEMAVGCWLRRMGPWDEPTEDYNINELMKDRN